ncbi:hypothetical protein WAJ71_21785, partial [Acinetobacter baumannii]
WLRSYQPEMLFTKEGTLRDELRGLAPKGEKRMSANHHANAGGRRYPLRLPDAKEFSVKVERKGTTAAENTSPLGCFLREVIR